MKKWRKNIAFLLSFILLISQSTIINADEAVTVVVNNSKTAEQVGDTREYEIKYNVGVSFDQPTYNMNVVLVLDRSNSMLYLDGNNPVAKTVWDGVNDFVDAFYESYSTGKISLVSYGSSAQIGSQWYSASQKSSALNAITYIYDYESASGEFDDYDFDYGWKNWDLWVGGTNIASGFDTAGTMLNQVVDAGNKKTVILFTDGMATSGGNPTVAAGNLPDNVDIITVGYFEGISDEDDKDDAKAALTAAQNAGDYNASTLDDISDIFVDIVDTINNVGKNAKITDVIEPEFEIVPGSVVPDATLGTNSEGKQTITWNLGSVTATNYNTSYKVRVKDNVFPTGTGSVEVPITDGAIFSFTNLDDVIEPFDLGTNVTTIPSLYNTPQISVLVTYENGQMDYLVGDTIKATHNLELVGHESFDYVEIDVDKLAKTINVNIDNVFEKSDSTDNDEWSILNKEMYMNELGEVTATTPSGLAWSVTKVSELVAKSAGEFEFDHYVEFNMTNEFGVVDSITTNIPSAAPLRVKESVLTFSLVDDSGVEIAEHPIISESVNDVVTDEYGEAVVKGLPSGVHVFRMAVPSGYALDDGSAASNVVLEDDEIVVTTILDYANAVQDIDIPLIGLDVKDISITTLSGSHNKSIDTASEVVYGKIEFTTLRDMQYISFKIEDNYSNGEFEFVFDHVENQWGNTVNRFSVSNNVMTYQSNRSWKGLDDGTYTVYGQFKAPSNFPDEGSSYDVDISKITTRAEKRGWSNPSKETYNITAEELTVGLRDDGPPTIVATKDEATATVDSISYNVVIEDDRSIAEYKVGVGNLTVAEMRALSSSESITLTTDQSKKKVFDYTLPITQDAANALLRAGEFTVYAKDAAGNEVVETYDYSIMMIDTTMNFDIL